ncbi:MAG: hypothetical protein V3V08_14505 [Nannocystaceae bacterium]
MLLTTLAVVLGAACERASGTDASSEGPHTGPSGAADAGECDPHVRVGRFELQTYKETAIIQGNVHTAPSPLARLEEVSAQGGCALVRQQRFFCDPRCAADEVCGPGDACITRPRPRSVGEVTVQGLGEDLRLLPVEPGFVYFDTSRPKSAIEAGEPVWLEASGGDMDVEPIELGVVGIAALHVSTGMTLVVAHGAPLDVAWDAAVAEHDAEIVLRLQVDQHGGTPASVVCRFEDTGSGIVPAGILAKFLDLGITGFPNATITRLVASRTPGAEDCVDFVASASLEIGLSVDNVTPCHSDADCPPGQTCNKQIEICE